MMTLSDTHNTNIINDLARLKWACRRGMLELDVLLNRFLVSGYPHLTPEQKESFAFFLTQSDPELYAWLMGYEQPTDNRLIFTTQLVRQYAQPQR